MEKNTSLTTQEIAGKVYNGEYDNVDDLKMAVKMLLNANGSEINDIKDRMTDQINYSTLKRDFNGIEFIPVDSVLEIIKETK